MSDITTPANTVSFSVQDAVNIAEQLGEAAALIDPKLEAGIAAITGIASLIDNVVVPAIQKLHSSQLSVVQQASLAAQSAIERAKVGAPAAVSN